MGVIAQAAHALSVLSLIWQHGMHGVALVVRQQRNNKTEMALVTAYLPSL